MMEEEIIPVGNNDQPLAIKRWLKEEMVHYKKKQYND